MKKNILLIAPVFYHYHTSIVSCLQNLGFNVIFYPELPTGYYSKVVKNVSPSSYNRLIDKYFLQLTESVESVNIDFVFVIRGEKMPEWFLSDMRTENPTAAFVMYQWDSLRNNNYEHLVKHFDRVFTFDPLDAASLNIGYLPLFYIKTNESVDVVKDIDYLFVGSLHSNRLELLTHFKKTLPKNENAHFHVYVSFSSYIKILLRGRFIPFSDVSFRTLPFHRVSKLVARAKNIVDLCSPNQTGVTVRSFEALSSGCRLITNNRNAVALFPALESQIDVVEGVIQYKPFYSSAPATKIENEFLSEYEINNWLVKVIDE